MTTIENKELEESWVKQDWVYIKTALILAFFTAIEVFTYFESVHKAPRVVTCNHTFIPYGGQIFSCCRRLHASQR